MRISDWSSDVCSSDLLLAAGQKSMTRHRLRLHSRQGKQHMTDIPLATILRINAARTIPLTRYEEEGNFDRFGYIKDLAENNGADQIGRASCRERVCTYV